MSVTVRITETYDLKTTINKLGIIGIHTPDSAQIRKMYPGLVKNHKFMRILKCDVLGVCASALPADPLQVGVENGQVAPEDMFNPILYKAVSNESFETLVSRIYRQMDVTSLGSLNQGDLGLSASNQFSLYYGLLASKDGWKKTMPQNGFALRGLYPICYQMVNTFGNISPPMEGYIDGVGETGSTNDTNVAGVRYDLSQADDLPKAVSFRGRSVKMPRIPMHYGPEAYDAAPAEFIIPKTFVGVFVTPPARMTEFYYRMRVSWSIRFEEVISTAFYGTGDSILAIGANSYGKNFTYASSKAEMENVGDSVDTNDVSISKIMEA